MWEEAVHLFIPEYGFPDSSPLSVFLVLFLPSVPNCCPHVVFVILARIVNIMNDSKCGFYYKQTFYK